MRKVSMQTGEYQNYQIAEYHYCKIKIYDNGKVWFIGSIHKMYNSLHGIEAPKRNGKGFNGNDFSIIQIIQIRDLLCDLFQCKPQRLVFENLEIGLNIIVSFIVKSYVRSLLYHNGKKFEFSRSDHFAEVLHNNYRIKIYDKGHQYGCANNILRVEVSAKKMIEFSSTGIRTFADVNKGTMERAYNHLLRRFDEVFYYDCTINKKSLKRSHLNNVKDYKRSGYWIDELSSNHRHRHRVVLKEITEQYSHNLKAQITNKLREKCVIINQLHEE
jgi:hypothetical protein